MDTWPGHPARDTTESEAGVRHIATALTEVATYRLYQTINLESNDHIFTGLAHTWHTENHNHTGCLPTDSLETCTSLHSTGPWA